MLKFLQIFQRLHFDLSFVDALLHIPKFASTFKSLLSNKEKLFELANTPLNENYECLALADLGVSINLMSLSVWKKLSLPELTPTRMTLDLANRSFFSYSVEDLVPILSESEDTFDSDKEYDLPFCDNSVTFSNPLFDANDDFTSSDDESLLEEDVPKENFKIYSNPLFEFDEEYISSDVNTLFNEVLEDIESKDSYVSNLDEQALLVTHLSKLNEDECFDPGGDEIEACFISDSIPSGIDDADFDPEETFFYLRNFEDDYYDSERDIIYLESLLIKETIPNLPPEVFLDHDPRSYKDEPGNDDLKNPFVEIPSGEIKVHIEVLSVLWGNRLPIPNGSLPLSRLLAEFFERRKKQLAAERAEAIRNKPPTRTQVRNRMITYLKHMGKYTHQQLKHKNFEEVQKLYEREKKWIDDFKPIDDDSQQQAESTKKRPRADSEEESSKKQKLEEDNDAEKEELRDSMDVVPRDDVAIDVESLATKYPIVDWKTHILNENMMYYQIIRADGSSKNYKIFSEMLDDFDRQDVIDLHRLVNERYETTSPEGYDLLLWGDLKTLFEPNEEDEIWKNQQDYNLISWRLFDSCGVHVLLMNTGVAIHMMIEKKYPLTQEMLSRMLNRRLEVDYESEMAFELLRFTRSQLQK
ncbi:hypothetical protein Tco_0561760 [Tanacetum coccineum]